MSELRPHWDDYLLASVMIHCSDIYQCHAVIAAVEDWHRDRWTGVCESPEEVVRELKQAQAAIQRVRELRQKWRHDVIATMGKALPGGVLSVPLNAVESQLGRALDGDGK